MGKGLTRSIARAPKIQQNIVKETFLVRDVVLDVDGATGIGDAQVVAADFPEGNILFLGAVANLTFAGAGSQAGLSDTWNGDFAIGTTADADDDLSGTDGNIVPSTAVGPAVAEVAPVARGASTTAAVFDNTDGSLELNLNFIVDDADISADDQVVTVNGEIYVAYVVLGDD